MLKSNGRALWEEGALILNWRTIMAINQKHNRNYLNQVETLKEEENPCDDV